MKLQISQNPNVRRAQPSKPLGLVPRGAAPPSPASRLEQTAERVLRFAHAAGLLHYRRASVAPACAHGDWNEAIATIERNLRQSDASPFSKQERAVHLLDALYRLESSLPNACSEGKILRRILSPLEI